LDCQPYAVPNDNLDTFNEEMRARLKAYQPKELSLYRYCSVTSNLLGEILSGNLFLPSNGMMNDAFEGIAPNLRGYDISRRLWEQLDDVAFFRAFAEDNQNLAMWGCYADNFRGICVEYNMKEILNAYGNRLYPVCYMPRKMTPPNDMETLAHEHNLLKSYYKKGILNPPMKNDEGKVLSDCFLREIRAQFLVKSPAWKHEREWRILFTYKELAEDYLWRYENETGDYDLADYEFKQVIPFPYITNIYLGPNISEENQAAICCAVQKAPYKMRVYRSWITAQDYRLRYKKVRG
jgi:hypothetical protein